MRQFILKNYAILLKLYHFVKNGEHYSSKDFRRARFVLHVIKGQVAISTKADAEHMPYFLEIGIGLYQIWV